MTAQKPSVPLNTVTFTPALYRDYTIPNGFLRPEMACQALWHYYITAIENYKHETDDLIYEGYLDPKYNYSQLFLSIAMMYGVEPGQMENYWSNIDMQCHALGVTKLPDKERYRFNVPLTTAH